MGVILEDLEQEVKAIHADQNDLNVVGKRIKRIEALAKALGTARYAADLKRDDMLIGKALFAKHPHALIKKIDTSRAEELEGVIAVMTAKDLPGRNGYGILIPDKPVIAEKKVKYQGDPVALVAAVNEEIAKKALDLIEVEYAVLPALDDPREAMKDDAVLIHENHPAADKGNILTEVSLTRGDVDKAFAEADIIIENLYETPMVDHSYLEPDVCIAEPDPITGGLLLIAPAQFVHATKRSLAPVFNLPPNKVRVLSPVVGAGYGGKEDSCLDVCSIAGVLALRTKKTVYFELTREEIFRNTGKRHATYIKHRLAATREGKVTAIDVETILDKGAYVSMGGLREPTHAVTQRTVMYAGGAYAIPNARAKSYSVFTNHPYSCAMRGFGAPQAYFAVESQMDELARKLEMDPIELRLKNIVRDGDRTIFGQVMKKSRGLGLEECIAKVKERMEWEKPLERTAGSRKRGRGFSTFLYGTGVPLPFEGASCYATFQTDGTVSIAVSSTEMGQGLLTAFTQIAAETLGVDFDNVVVNISDTDASPDAGPTVASRSTTVVGNAIINGCTQLKNRIMDFASRELKADSRDIDIKEGKVFIVGKPETAVPLGSMVAKAFVNQVPLSATGVWYPPRPTFSGEDGQGDPMHAYAFGAQGVEIEVDTETGEIDIVKFVLACDVGKAINPVNVEQQMEGGAAMGIGWSLMEEIDMSNGVMKNDSFKNYPIPSIKDVPEMDLIIVEHPNELGPFGAKGIGEPPTVPTAPAIRNALYDALGIKFNKIPFTPQRVIEEIKKYENKNS
jgi:CO/xanthine dehydrogenase Mo-binding subunit